MSIDSVVLIYLGVLTPLLGVLLFARLNRIEATLQHIAATYVPREEFRAEMSASREEFRHEIGGVRSDITQVALAVGAGPRASEG